MTKIDWSDYKPSARKPTRREIARYNRWRKYLKDSKLNIDEQHTRAASYAESGQEPDNQ